MININQYILEKLKISKDSKYKFNPDEMEGPSILFYDDSDPDEESDYDYLKDVLDKIDNEYEGFALFRWDSISDCKDFYKSFEMVTSDLKRITERAMDGRSMGYAVKLDKGRLIIDNINSGSRASYYIYALTNDGYNKLTDFLEEEIEDTSIFFDENNFVQIKDDVLTL